MSATFENLQILKSAEEVGDSIWKQVVKWNEFSRDTVGKQLARSADSIGANIAESFGRFNFGEKIQFLYYARGSLFETKYWLNRVETRNMMNTNEVKEYSKQLTELAKQLNTFTSGLKTVRAEQPKKKNIAEAKGEYSTDLSKDLLNALLDFLHKYYALKLFSMFCH